MKKPLLFILLLFVLSAMAVGCSGNFPEESEESTAVQTQPNPAEDFEYTLNNDGSGVLITKYVGEAEDVVIPSEIDGLPVLALRNSTDPESGEVTGAFFGSAIKSVYIPETVASIYLAFAECAELTEVGFAENSQLKTISQAFTNCTSLESIDLSSTELKDIGALCFSGCSSLREIKFSDTVAFIGARAFYDCTSLEELDLPDCLTRVDYEAFGNCTSLRTVTIPKELDLRAFDKLRFFNNPALERIIFKDGREEIRGYAFFEITSNPEIIIPASVKKFSAYPFFIYGSAKMIFKGDYPELVEWKEFYGDPVIYYDPATKGWDGCEWKNNYRVEPVE